MPPTDWTPKERRAAMNKLATRMHEDPTLLQKLRNNPDAADQTLKAANAAIAPTDLPVLQDMLRGKPVAVLVDLEQFALPKPPYDDNDTWGNWGGMWGPGGRPGR